MVCFNFDNKNSIPSVVPIGFNIRLSTKVFCKSNLSTSKSSFLVPDFKISIENNELILELNYRNSPTLNISRDYDEMLKGYKLEKNKSKSQREAIQFIKQKLDSAKWFIDAVKQRQQTLFITMQAIMNYQKE